MGGRGKPTNLEWDRRPKSVRQTGDFQSSIDALETSLEWSTHETDGPCDWPQATRSGLPPVCRLLGGLASLAPEGPTSTSKTSIDARRKGSAQARYESLDWRARHVCLLTKAHRIAPYLQRGAENWRHQCNSLRKKLPLLSKSISRSHNYRSWRRNPTGGGARQTVPLPSCSFGTARLTISFC